MVYSPPVRVTVARRKVDIMATVLVIRMTPESPALAVQFKSAEAANAWADAHPAVQQIATATRVAPLVADAIASNAGGMFSAPPILNLDTGEIISDGLAVDDALGSADLR